MEKQYAHALVEAMKRGVAPEKALTELRSLVSSRGHDALWGRIARELSRIAARERAKEPVLTVAREADIAAARSRAEAELAGKGIDTAKLHVKTDDTLIGGWELVAPGFRIDASFKKHLLDLYRTLTV